MNNLTGMNGIYPCEGCDELYQFTKSTRRCWLCSCACCGTDKSDTYRTAFCGYGFGYNMCEACAWQFEELEGTREQKEKKLLT